MSSWIGHAPPKARCDPSDDGKESDVRYSKPLGLLEQHEQVKARHRYQPEHDEVSIGRVQFRHMLEVHAVYSSDRRRDCQYCRPSRELAGDHTRPLRFQKAAELKDCREDLKEAVDHGLHAIDVIRDIVEVWSHIGADAGKVAANELSHQLAHSPECALEAREFASQSEDAGDFLSSEKAI